jgi:hypothetical protein
MDGIAEESGRPVVDEIEMEQVEVERGLQHSYGCVDEGTDDDSGDDDLAGALATGRTERPRAGEGGDEQEPRALVVLPKQGKQRPRRQYGGEQRPEPERSGGECRWAGRRR